jgi:hypothetical protein
MKPTIGNRYPSIDFTPLVIGVLIAVILIISNL